MATSLAIGTDTAPRHESVPTQLAVMLPALPAAPAAAAAPHFDLGQTGEDHDSSWWVMAIMLAMGAGVCGYALVWLLTHVRL